MRQAATASGKAGKWFLTFLYSNSIFIVYPREEMYNWIYLLLGNMKVFQKVFEKLVSVGGGDKTNLSCSGSYSGGGAEQMKNLRQILK